MTGRRAGAALLEALVALVILSTAALSGARLVSEAGRTVARAREAEAELRRANAFMHAITLWSREDLDRHLGACDEGQWVLHIQRDAPSVYDIVLVEKTEQDNHGAATPSRRVLLTTSVYRPVDRATR
jgi:type II secretory pathway pseudopilin PulG